MPVPSISPLDHRQTVISGDIAEVFTGRTLGRTGVRGLRPPPPEGRRPKRQLYLLASAGSGTLLCFTVYERSTRARLRLGDVCLTSAAHKPRYIGLKVDLVDDMPAEGAMASARLDQGPRRCRGDPGTGAVFI